MCLLLPVRELQHAFDDSRDLPKSYASLAYKSATRKAACLLQHAEWNACVDVRECVCMCVRYRVLLPACLTRQRSGNGTQSKRHSGRSLALDASFSQGLGGVALIQPWLQRLSLLLPLTMPTNPASHSLARSLTHSVRPPLSLLLCALHETLSLMITHWRLYAGISRGVFANHCSSSLMPASSALTQPTQSVSLLAQPASLSLTFLHEMISHQRLFCWSITGVFHDAV